MKNNKLITFGIGALFVLALFVVLRGSDKASASAPSGLQATVATSTELAVSGTASTLISTSTCSARIISTRGNAIMLTFSDYANHTPTATFGHLQSASTTVVYDSGQYGCGKVKAYSYGTETITVTETR